MGKHFMTLCIDYSTNKIKPPLTQLDLSNIWANLSDSLIFLMFYRYTASSSKSVGALNSESRARTELKEEKKRLKLFRES